ncbi:non-ribosomal peptide synthetase [Thiomonas intermedia]|uniref:non-ribosomal peptide synthetase n=1 Tax=Thiomonas intermedia TaxID=926 RepID=UPI001FE6F88D
MLLRQELFGSAIYNIGVSVTLDGPLDQALLEQAICDIVVAEPMLRARVLQTPEGPCWHFDAFTTWRLAYTDLFAQFGSSSRAIQEAEHAVAKIKSAPIQPYGTGLWKSVLFRIDAQQHVWLMCFNHLLLDGYGEMLLGQRIAQRYNALLSSTTQTQEPGPLFLRFIEREQAYLRSPRFASDQAFWRERFPDSGAAKALSPPHLEALPTPIQHRWTPPPAQWEAFLQAAASYGLTPALAVLFFLATYLARVTGQIDLLIGMPLHNRKDPVDKQTLGLFANTLPLRLTATGDQNLPSIMRALADDARQVWRHLQFPLDRALAGLPAKHAVSGMPFDLMVSFEPFHPHVALGSARMTFSPFSGHPGLAPVAAYVRDYGDSQSVPIDLVLDPRAPAAMTHTEHLSDRLDRHLSNLLARPEQRLCDLDVLPDRERAALAALNLTAQPRAGTQCLHHLVSEQARRTPDAIAVRFGTTRLSYHALEQAADRLALNLRRLGVGRDVNVPVMMERCPALVVALLAVLKAGGAYVPLDTDIPTERLRRILQDTDARLVLAQESLHPVLREASPADRTPLQLLDADLAATSADLGDTPSADCSSDDPALVIFTSGSTGQPKGVVIPHRALCNHKLWNVRAVRFGPQDRLLQKSSLSFDASISEIFMPLICGAAVYLAPPGLQRDLPAMLQTVRHQGITHLTLAPSTARALVDDPLLPSCTRLRYLQFGGEPLDAALAARFQALLPNARLLNFYGPSETTEDSTLYVVDGLITQARGNLPVGRPIDNTRVYVLDEQLRPQPFDVVGEICIAGLGVALGYLGQPERTAERFLPDPFEPGDRMYRSGDLGYWSADGQLHLVGRNDDQIKIRGFRIEIGEIERSLSAHPAVAQAAVAVWMAQANDPQLAAYVVLREAHADTPLTELRQALEASLPHYMVPSAWQALPALPLTASGKIDKRRLPTPQVKASSAVARLPPRNPTEQTLWSIWHDVLGIEAFGVLDSFFELGGHSLSLTQVRSRILQQLGIELPLIDLFSHLTVAQLAAHIDQKDPVDHADVIPAVPRGAPLPASLSQRRMWVIQQFHPESVAYNVSGSLRFRGPFHIELFAQALALLVARHEGLRTCFTLQGNEPRQVILPELRPRFDLRDLSGLPAEARESAARQAASTFTAEPFDLSAAPLFRLCLMRMSDDEHIMLWVLHHAIADNWAMAILSRDVLQLYAGLLQGRTDPADMGLAPLSIQYADYAAWQRSAPAAARENSLEDWLGRLRGLSDLPLPTDFPRPAQPSHMGHALFAPMSESLQQALRDYGARHGVTPFMLLLASFNVLLARICRCSDIAVGTPIANRHHAATEQLVGTLVNTLVMRNTVEMQASFDQLVQQVRATALHAYAHQDAPFDELVERLEAQRADHPQGLVRVLFNVLNAPTGKLADVPFTYEAFDFDRVAAQFDLSIHVDTEFTRRIHLEYATDLFSAETAQRLLDSYVFLTEQLLAQPARPVSSHALVTPAQRALLDQWNATPQPLPAPLTLPAALQLDAPDRRDRPALTDAQGHTLRYGDLHTRALGIAHHLRRMGVGRGDRVGLCLHRQPDMMAALLGVLHAGAAYVPLDPGFPPERLRYMATDAQLRCLLTQADLMALMAETGVPQLALDRAPLAHLRCEDALAPDPVRDARPDDPAYMIYTSGSTGRPKGVQVPHRAVVNFLRSMAREPGLRREDVLLAVTTLSFDIAVLELLLPLTVGARVILADLAQSRDPFALRELLHARQPTALQAAPSTWRMLLDAGWRGQRGLRALIGGEALPADLAPRLLQACDEVWNLYGPTETTVWSTCWRVQPRQAIVIGRPIANTQVWILDPQGQLCPIGTPGEIHIGGDGVTLGYFQRPELTAERFIADPFSTDPHARLYKTGDLGRWRHDGQLEHLGRLDHQVKIRGFRIELGEIEAVLREQAGVASCVLTTYAPTPDDVRLVAYIVPPPGTAAPLPGDLRQTLRLRLPDYMVPQHIVPLDALPLLPNGKLDRAALPAPRADAPARKAGATGSEQPGTPEEHQIAEIWHELLGVDQVLLTDNFFDLGGHSLLAMRAVIAIEQQLGWRIAPRRLIFESLGQIARPALGRGDAA